MKIIIADHSGFCYGVKKAIEDTEKILEENGHTKVLGPLIHNPLEVKRLEDKGLKIINDPDQAKNDRVIIRSHGAGELTFRDLETRGNDVVNCTCPYVSKIHRIVSEYYGKKYGIIIIGDSNHPEVMGINGWCANSATIVKTLEEVEALSIQGPTCIVGQTTFNTELWEMMINILRTKSDELVIYNTICAATANRQQSARDLASTVDVMIVIGGKNSSNSKKLYEICNKLCAVTYFVESYEELPFDRLKGDIVIGVTAGASTPDWVIQEIINKLEGEEIVNEHNNGRNTKGNG